MGRIGEAMALGQRGERAPARALFAEVWAAIGEDGDPFHRCALAHAMADVQDDVADELLWDERALAAADELTDERVAAGGVPTGVAGFYRRCTSTSPSATAGWATSPRPASTSSAGGRGS